MDGSPEDGCARRIVVGRAGELPPWLLDGMFRLRHAVFHERLRWDVDSRDGRERDRFDDCDPVYVISYAEAGRKVTGCCRLLRTDGPYMLRDVFPEALRGVPAPRDPAVWEASRLATDRPWSGAVATGLGSLARALVREVFGWVDRHGDTVVAFSSVDLEHGLNAMGVPTRRFGDGGATRLDGLVCSAYAMSTAAFLRGAHPARKDPPHCPLARE
ncbi:acyl-homoserine-lactone synthase [Nonomuraea rhodomycinica]|uniref:acyl-homoserine-lactone synthase n=1 Tax=Nonomuraea rhodomycinica TaxID=1712872 RepID=A0A7Y6MH50_9ACTN|nr:acyl-homoserine-lactone synthase [Nonomuraea rhodomycinica]NUW46609.1 conjugal transfer protein TraI [Nonomuraea rhodomycinica]